MRYEKALAALPVAPCPAIEQKPKEQIDKYRSVEYIRYEAEVLTVKGEDILSVTTYDTEGKSQFRFFLLKDQYGLQVFEPQTYSYSKKWEPGKIYRSSIDTAYYGIYTGRWSSNVQRMYGTPDSSKAVYRFLGKSDDEPIKLFCSRVKRIRQERIDARDEKARAELREAFTGVDKEIPTEFKTFAEEVPLRDTRYFFFDYTGKKEQSGVCSHCGKRATIPGIKERKHGICPNCGTTFKYYSAKRLCRTHGIVERKRAAFLLPVNENRIAVRCCQVGIALRGGSTGVYEKEVWAHEDLRFFLNGEGKEIERYAAPEGTTKIYLDGLTKCGWTSGVNEHWIAPMNLEPLRKNMGIYTPLETLAAYGLQVPPNVLFTKAKEKPKIEYLIKMGLLGMASYEFFDVYHIGGGKQATLLLKEGKSAAQLLGVTPDTIPLLKDADPSGRAFLVIRSLLDRGLRLTSQDMKDISRLGIENQHSEKLFNMAKTCSIHKALKYIYQQGEIFRSGGSHVLQQWSDYIGIAKQLHINLGDHCAMLPKNLKAAHDEAVKLLDCKKNEKLNAKVKKTADQLQDLCWEYNGLTIRPAVSQGELFNEGQALSHCVGRMGYAEKMANGQTAIFFIRTAKAPNESYVTLELNLKTWEKIQCYGKHDTFPGSKVGNFVKKWITEVVKPTKEPPKTELATRVKLAV